MFIKQTTIGSSQKFLEFRISSVVQRQLVLLLMFFCLHWPTVTPTVTLMVTFTTDFERPVDSRTLLKSFSGAFRRKAFQLQRLNSKALKQTSDTVSIVIRFDTTTLYSADGHRSDRTRRVRSEIRKRECTASDSLKCLSSSTSKSHSAQ